MKIYVSSTLEDLKGHRSTLKYALLGIGHEPVMLDDQFPNSLPTKKELVKLIEDADIFIGIYAHLYGYMSRGDDISLTEKEYRIAMEKGKEIFPFIISPDVDWPDIYREDDFIKQGRLDTLLKEISSGHKTFSFSTPKDIVSKLTPVLENLSVKYDRLKRLQESAQSLPAGKKLKLLHQLSVANQDRRISASAFSTATRLIAGNFDTDKHSPGFAMVDDVEKLLWDKISVEAFIDNAVKIPRSAPSLKEMPNSVLLGALGIVILLCGFMLDRWLAPVNSVGQPVMAQTITENPLTESKAGEAPERPPDEKPDLETSAARAPEQEAQPPVSETALPGGKKPDEETIVAEDNILAAAGTAQTSQISDSIRTDDVAEAAAGEAPESDKGNGAEKLAALLPAAESVEDPILRRQIAAAGSDTLTAYQSLTAWQAFASDNSLTVEAKDYAALKVTYLDSLLKASAGVDSPANFLLCRNVNPETRMPEGESTVFAAGKIWMWVRINTPRPDEITAKWYLDGKLLFSKTASIPVASPGYRIYFSKSIDEGSSGEVRLFNSENLMIGRKIFIINDDAVSLNSAGAVD